MLKADAELAWTYFDWGAKNFNGMVPATSWMEFGKQAGYPFTTMWDVGTHILATSVGTASRHHRASRIRNDHQPHHSFLGETSFRYAGGKLPHTERALRAQGDQRDGFDSADTGRLLVALKILDNATAGAFPVFDLVSKLVFQAGAQGRRNACCERERPDLVGACEQLCRLCRSRLQPVGRIDQAGL